MLSFDLSAKADFFPAVIESAKDKAETRFKRRAGAFARKVARGRVRRRKRASRPGQTPSQRSSQKLQGPKAIWFADGGNAAVVGLVDLPGDGQNVPEAWEHGGTLTVETPEPDDKNTPRQRRRTKRRHRVKIEARPIMAPALEKVSPKLAEFMKDEVR